MSIMTKEEVREVILEVYNTWSAEKIARLSNCSASSIRDFIHDRKKAAPPKNLLQAMGLEVCYRTKNGENNL